MPKKADDVGYEIADAIYKSFMSPNESDSNMEAANIVDVVAKVSRSLRSVSQAITAAVEPANDAAGGRVGSLTEAVMGVTAGLCKIADAIESLAVTDAHSPPILTWPCSDSATLANCTGRRNRHAFPGCHAGIVLRLAKP